MSFLKDYIGLGIPIWMQSRKNLFFFSCLDFILIFLIKTNFLSIKFNTQNIIITFLISIVWCLISYVIGKYSYYQKNEFLVSKLFNLFKSNLISIILIYLLDKLLVIFFPEILTFGKNKIFLLGIFSFVLQTSKLVIFKKMNKKKKLYILGNKNEVASFRDFLKEFPIFKSIKLIDFTEQISNQFEKKNVLILNENLESKFNYQNLIGLNVKIFTPFKWCEKYLNRIPNKYLSKKEYEKHDWVIDSDSFQWRLKRFGDITVSLFLILVTIPLIIIFSFLIWLEDKGPIFYRQKRTGLNGKEILLTKLRTMKHDSEKYGPVWASKNDKRITKVGNFLRKTRIDELPQLFSVLLGDMSLIGPRPERPGIEIILKKHIPNYELRKVIKPGLSGWAQVNFDYGASIEDSEVKLSYELFYIRNQSFWLDILIFIKTIKLIINMKGSKPKK